MVLGVLEDLLSADCLVYIIVQTLMNKAPLNELMYLCVLHTFDVRYQASMIYGIKY